MAYENIVAQLRKSFNADRTRPIEWRIDQLKALHRMYEENESIFCEALEKDLRKPR